jgi:predicted anti-sigma-YlaC factor YlaD
MKEQSSPQSAQEVTCQEVAEWASAYLEQHVDDPTKVRMALHLVLCAGCDAYVRQIAAVRDLVGLLPEPSPDQAQRDRLRQAFVAQQKRPSSRSSE